MTADERIEKLLNHFGETISDLPKPDNTAYAYEGEDINKAYETSFKWHNERVTRNGILLHSGDYICHLEDIINKMETALNTAVNVMNCKFCQHEYECDYECDEEARVSDQMLSGMSAREFEEFVGGSDDC